MFTLNQLWVGMDRFHFFEKRSFRFENDEEKRKTKNDPSLTKGERRPFVKDQ